MEFPKLSLIPLFIEASTREELILLMIANNSINSQAFNYFEPKKDGKKWVVWFFADINNWKRPEIPKDDVQVFAKESREIK